MSEQTPAYRQTKKVIKYRVYWHNGEIALWTNILADDIIVDPDSGILYLYLEGDLVFIAQTWTSVVISSQLPQ